MKTQIIWLLIPFLFIYTNLKTQTFEDFKKEQNSDLETMKKEQEVFLQNMQYKFDEYVNQRDKEFVEYLKNQWESFQVFKGQELAKSPKPDVVPKADNLRKEEITINKITSFEPQLRVEDVKPDRIVIPHIKKSDELIYNKTSLTFNFFGVRIILDYDQRLKIDPPAIINPSIISDTWSQLSRANYSGLIDQLESYKTKMNLNDWAYYRLIDEFSKTVYQGSKNEENLLNWFLLNRSGYNSKLAYTNNMVSVILPSFYKVFSKDYLTFQNKNYYLMRDLGSNEISTYKLDYPGSVKSIDFNIKSPLNFEKKIVRKSLGFNFSEIPYSLNISYNQNLIDFYKDYPQVNINIYFNAAVSAETKESLLEGLRPIVNEMSETEAVSFLLKFVQTSFEYKTDEQQFAKEKFFFPEEILHYPFSDCEDRSVFFAYLVNELLNLKVIGLEYPGHIATAVKFNTDVIGDYILYGGENYIIADATFVNAPIGLTIPAYRSEKAKIIELSNYHQINRNYKSIWERAEESGGYRGNNYKDIIFDSEENAYLTGYFIGRAKFDDYFLDDHSDVLKRSFFVASYNKNGNINWVKEGICNKNVTGFSITLDDNDNIYVAGSFDGNLTLNNDQIKLQCKDGKNDVFVAKYNKDGNLIWAEKAGLDSEQQENNLTYMTKFDINGICKGTTLFNESMDINNFGLQLGPMNLLYLLGSFHNTSGFFIDREELVVNEESSFDLLASLKEESDNLILNHYEKHIAGLFSVLNHIKLQLGNCISSLLNFEVISSILLKE